MNQKTPRKRNKFVPVTTKKNNDSYVMPGRQKCECAATKHDLINNCTSCGRIICSQEGSGPCWFCGELVCTNEDFEKISRSSNRSQSLFQQLSNKTWAHQNEDINLQTTSENTTNDDSEEYKLAEEKKQRLLDFDRTSARRTKVIDDERDYYQTEGKVWMDPKNKELLKQKEKKLRDERYISKSSQPMKYTLDFKKGQLIEEKSSNDAAYELFEEPDLEIMTNYSADVQTVSNIDTEFLEYIASTKKPTKQEVNKQITKNHKLKRIQDKELYEIRDEGMCLSMHQPWASLLVKGIKKHEGRSWFTSHRGRLWIAATAKVPSPELINEYKQFYLSRGVTSNEFPINYPTGCILGCVDVIECLPEEDYIEMYPDGESGSPFIFICENPIELNLKFPIKGKHKIYKLESHVHNAAKCGIQMEA